MKEVPLKGDKVVGGWLPDPNVAEHLVWGSEELWSMWDWWEGAVKTCVGAEVKVGGVGAGDAVALPLLGGGGGRLVEMQRPTGGDGQLPFLTLLPFLLLPERPNFFVNFSINISPLVPSVHVLQDGCRYAPKVWAATFVSRTIMLGGALLLLLSFPSKS